jgi:hypothetical protein
VFLVLARRYYGTSLPLPFYAKSHLTTHVGARFAELCASSRRMHLGMFVACYGPLGIVAVIGRSKKSIAPLVAALAFIAYHEAFTLDVMGYRARFLLPAVVPLVLAAAASWDQFVDRVPLRQLQLGLAIWTAGGIVIGMVANGSGQHRVSAVAYVILPCVLWSSTQASERVRYALGALALGVLPLVALLTSSSPRWARFLSDEEYAWRSTSEVTSFRGLGDLVRCIPELRQLYHSEIGVVGVVLPKARIVDLVGLMSKEIAFSDPRFDDYCLRDLPEAIFLPHRNYAELNREIAGSSCIRRYTRVTNKSSSPLYVRSDLAGPFQACSVETARWR